MTPRAASARRWFPRNGGNPGATPSPRVILTVVVVTLLPVLLGLAGGEARLMALPHATREILHHLIEWSAFLCAGLGFALGGSRFLQDQELLPMLVAMGMLAAGGLDGMHALQSLKLLPQRADTEQWCALNWTLGRTVQALLLVIGGAVTTERRRLSPRTWVGLAALGSVLLLAGAYRLSNSVVPRVVFPAAAISHPWDLIPLALALGGGLLLLSGEGWSRASHLRQALLLSCLPLIAAQVTIAFGSRAALDYPFMAAHGLKLLAYALPLVGMALDYGAAFEREALSVRAAAETAERLESLRLAGERGERSLARQFRGVFDTSLDAIFLLDARSYEILDVNPSACRLLGYSLEEFRGLNALAIHPDEMDRLLAFARDAAAMGGARTTELSCLAKDGRRIPAEVSAAFFSTPEEREVMVATVRDQTRLRAAEDARLQLQRELAHAQRLQAIGRLAAGVAHDFNNLLTVIVAAGSELASRPDVDAEVTAAGRMITNAGSQAAGLTQQLLAFSRRQRIAPALLDLGDVLSGIEARLRRLVPAPVRLTIETGPTTHWIRVDPVMLDQVIMNLAVNARDAMPRGGELTLRLSRQPDEISGAPCVVLEVRDTGDGIPPETLPHIFEPFFTTKDRGRGTGLGLATVHGIVEQHGGRIRVESTLARGTAFFVAFPRAEPRPEGGEAVDAATVSGTLRGVRTLVVDDDAAIRRTVRTLLEQEGCGVGEAESTEEAIAAIAERHGAIDLLVTDVVMPGPTGIELARTARSRWPRVRVLVMSAYYPERLDSGEGGPFEFLAKPFTREDLLGAVRRALRSGSSDFIASA